MSVDEEFLAAAILAIAKSHPDRGALKRELDEQIADLARKLAANPVHFNAEGLLVRLRQLRQQVPD